MEQYLTDRIKISLVGAAVFGALCAAPLVASAAPAAHHAKLTVAQATKIALHRFPGKVQGKVALEDEEGGWQYSVMIQSRGKLREVMVDANTGRIQSVETTSASKERAESHQGARHKGADKDND